MRASALLAWFVGYGRRVGAGIRSDLLYGLTPPGCLVTGRRPGPREAIAVKEIRSDVSLP